MKHLESILRLAFILMPLLGLSACNRKEPIESPAAQEKPQNRLNAHPTQQQKLWVQATCAMLHPLNGDVWQYLENYDATSNKRARAKDALSRWWSINDAEQLREKISWASEEGHRMEFDEMAKALPKLTPEQWRALQAEMLRNRPLARRVDVVRKNAAKWGPNALLGWDLARCIALYEWGCVAGYTSEDQAWPDMIEKAQQLQNRYKSWQEFGNSYLLGRLYWSGVEDARTGKSMSSIIQDLCTNRTSPWVTLPWTLDLEPQDKQN